MKRIIAVACILCTYAYASIVQATGLDTGFGNQGRVVVGAGEAVRAILQADGKVVVVGTTISFDPFFFVTPISSLPNADFLIARYNTDGTPDKTFAGSGLLQLDFNGGADLAAAVVQQPDGKLVVGGSAVNAAGEIAPAAVRLNTDGTLDTTFNSTGKVIYDSIPATYVSGTTQQTVLHGRFTFTEVFVLPGGKLLFSAPFYQGLAPPPSTTLDGTYLGVRVRVLSDGQLDASYGAAAAGWAGDSSDRWVQQPQGGFLATRFVGLGVQSAGLDIELVRYDADGVRDSTFASNGAVLLRRAPGSLLNDGLALAIRPNADVLIAGGESTIGPSPSYPPLFAAFVTQVNSQAEIDTSFGTNGTVRGYQGDFDTSTASLALEPGGKALLTGFAARTASSTSPQDVSIARLSEHGTPDPTFGPNGRVILDLSEGSTVYSSLAIDLLRRRDGHLLVVANRGKLTGQEGDRGEFVSGTERIVIEQLISTPQFALGAAAATVASSETSAVLTVTRTGNPDGAVSVDYATTGSTITQGTLTWQPGDPDSKTITVPVDASQRQTEKQFTLVLDNPSEGTVTSGPTVVTVAATATAGGTTAPSRGKGGGGGVDSLLLALLTSVYAFRMRQLSSEVT